jgi:DNA-binding CsgD family transcriptional regulator/streptogramin lyase
LRWPETVRAVLKWPGSSDGMYSTPDGESTLSRREREVAALVAKGLTNREIAERLFISERTVDGHLEHIRQKLGVSSRASVAAWFVAQAQSPGVDAAPAAAAPRVRLPTDWLRTDRLHWRVLRVAVPALVAAVLAVSWLGYARWANFRASTGPSMTTVTGISKPGSFEGGDTGDFGPATAAELYHPLGVAAGVDGSVYIADSYNFAIRKVDPHGTITTVAGGGSDTLTDGAFSTLVSIPEPAAVAVSSHGDVYFAGDAFVARLDPSSILHVLLGPTASQPLADVTGLAVASDGTLYIADRATDTVRRLTTDGSLSTYAGTGQPGFSNDGGSAAGAQLNSPVGLALDAKGNLYIADQGNNRIRKVDAATGTISTVAGSSDLYAYGGDGGLAVRAHLSLPAAVAVDASDQLYIADTGNNRIRRISRDGRIDTIAGTGAAGYKGDGGPAIAAQLYGPCSLSIASPGILYVADTANNRVRQVRLPRGST